MTIQGYAKLAVFGSIARREARIDSDIDLIVEAPAGTSSFDFIRFRQLLEQVLGREIDLVEYGGLKPGLEKFEMLYQHDAGVIRLRRYLAQQARKQLADLAAANKL